MRCADCRAIVAQTNETCPRCGAELLAHAAVSTASGSRTADAGRPTPGRLNVWDPPAVDGSEQAGEPWRRPVSSSWEAPPSKPAFFKRKGFYIPTAIVVVLIAIAGAAGSSSKKTTNLSADSSSQAPMTTPASTAPAPTAPPVTAAPVTAPPPTAPPVTAPPVTAPRVTAPPATAPRAAVPPATGKSLAGETTSQANARQKAADYLDYDAFSRSGLIKQLMYEGFTEADATYGVDAQNANWNEQAAKKAKDYLNYDSFSRDSLIKQLEYEGFTPAQAEYGASTTGL